MKKKITVFLALLVLITLSGLYFYSYQTYICKGSNQSVTTYLKPLWDDKTTKDQISFSFSWNPIKKELELSDIDDLTLPSMHIGFYNSNKFDSRASLSDKDKTIFFQYSGAPSKNKATGEFRHESTSLDFEKNSKFIVIEIRQTHESSRVSSMRTRSIRAQCERLWL